MPLIWTSAKHVFNGPSTFGLSMDISKIHSFKFLHKFAELKEYDKAGWLKLSIVDRWARSGGLSLHGCHPVLRRMVSSDGTTISLWSGVARSESAIKVVYWEVDAAVYHEEEVGYFEQSRNNLKLIRLASTYLYSLYSLNFPAHSSHVPPSSSVPIIPPAHLCISENDLAETEDELGRVTDEVDDHNAQAYSPCTQFNRKNFI